MQPTLFEHLANYFDETSRTVLKEGVSAWHALKRHDDWNHWLRVGKAIATAARDNPELAGRIVKLMEQAR